MAASLGYAPSPPAHWVWKNAKSQRRQKAWWPCILPDLEITHTAAFLIFISIGNKTEVLKRLTVVRHLVFRKFPPKLVYVWQFFLIEHYCSSIFTWYQIILFKRWMNPGRKGRRHCLKSVADHLQLPIHKSKRSLAWVPTQATRKPSIFSFHRPNHRQRFGSSMEESPKSSTSLYPCTALHGMTPILTCV